MNAYLFTAWISQVSPARLSDSCLSLIVYGGEAEEAQAGFEAWLLRSNEGDNPTPTQIERLVAAPVVGNLFTESSDIPIDWPQVVNEARIAMEKTEPDSTEEGYWVDCDAEIKPGSQIPDIESLRRGMPESIRSGLNWAANQKFFFLVSALSPPQPLAETSRAHDDESADCAEEGSSESGTGSVELRERQGTFPELVEKEAVALCPSPEFGRRNLALAPICSGYALGHELILGVVPLRSKRLHDSLADVATTPSGEISARGERVETDCQGWSRTNSHEV